MIAEMSVLSPLFDWVVRVSFEACLVAAVVLIVQAVLGGRVSARWRYNLWLLVVARLLLPAVPESRWSPFNLIPQNVGPVAVALGDGAASQAAGDGRANAAPQPPRFESQVEPPPPTDDAVTGVGPQSPAAPARPPVIPVGPQASVAHSPAASDDVVVHVRHDDLVADAATAAAGSAVSPAPPASRHADRRAASSLTSSESDAVTAAGPVAGGAAPPPPPPLRLWRWGASPWRTTLLGLWLAGVAFCIARLLWATAALAGVVRRAVPVNDPAALDLVRRCAAELRVARPPALLVGPDGFGPALVGARRPRLILPRAVLDGFRREELRMVILHELAHLRRQDVALNWLLALLAAVHWFNPLVWLAFRRMRADRELACDEMALAAAGQEARAAYGPALLKLLESFARDRGTLAAASPVPAPSASPGATGVLDSKAYLCRRIAMIARFDGRKPMRRPLLATALSLLAGGVALTGAVRGGQAEPPAGGGGGAAVSPAAAEAPDAGAPGAAPASATPGAMRRGAASQPTPETPADAGMPGMPGGPMGASDGGGGSPGTAMGGRGAMGGGGGMMRGMSGDGRGPARRGAPGGGGGAMGGMGGMANPGMGSAMGGMPGMPGMGGPAVAGAPAGALGRVEEPAEREADARTAANLKKPAPADFDGVGLADVLTHFADAAGVDLFVDTRGMEEVGVDQQARVTLRLREPIPAGQALEWILRSAGGDQIGYAIDRGVVVVTSREQLDRMVITRAYDVSDLARQAAHLPGGVEPGQDVDAVVRTTVAPGTWAENGGGTGSIIRFRDKLLVTTTEPIHREVEKLLSLLRNDTRRADGAGAGAANAIAVADATPEDIAKVDRQMAKFLEPRNEITLEIEQQKIRGAGDKAPALRLLEEQLKARDAIIKERTEWFRAKYKGYHLVPGGGIVTSPPGGAG